MSQSVVPTLIDPPGLGAPVEDWVAYRVGLDDLEARLCVDHPDRDWWPARQKIKREAHAGIFRAAKGGR